MAERREQDEGSADAPPDARADAEPDVPRRVAPPKAGELAGWYRMAGVGTEFVAAIGVFAAIGYFLDRWLGSSPWLVLAGCGLGFAVGLWLMYKAARDSFK